MSTTTKKFVLDCLAELQALQTKCLTAAKCKVEIEIDADVNPYGYYIISGAIRAQRDGKNVLDEDGEIVSTIFWVRQYLDEKENQAEMERIRKTIKTYKAL